MFCSLLVLAIISSNLRCNQCCSSYQCGLIDNSTLCNSKSKCKLNGDTCVGKVCGDFGQNDCAGSHNTGSYTDNFYCKWSDGACVTGTNDCADYNGDVGACLQTQKCKFDGTSCTSASSCADFSDTKYINGCSGRVFNNVQCVSDGVTCKPFSCVGLDNCDAYPVCYNTGSACAATTTCSAITDSTKCDNSIDSNGNECYYTGGACKTFACGDVTDQLECGFRPGCSWKDSKCVEGNTDLCSILTEATTCNLATCNFITSCPAEPSSSHKIFMPVMLVALALVFLL